MTVSAVAATAAVAAAAVTVPYRNYIRAPETTNIIIFTRAHTVRIPYWRHIFRTQNHLPCTRQGEEAKEKNHHFYVQVSSRLRFQMIMMMMMMMGLVQPGDEASADRCAHQDRRLPEKLRALPFPQLNIPQRVYSDTFRKSARSIHHVYLHPSHISCPNRSIMNVVENR